MNKAKFERRVLDLDLYGESYKLTFPTKVQGEKMSEKAKELSKDGDDASSEALIELLEEIGLPREASNEMEIEHLTELVEMLFPTKKK